MAIERVKVQELTRRGVLGMLVGAGTAAAFACGGESTGGSSAGSGDGGAGAGSNGDGATSGSGDASIANADGSACGVTPEGEIGPYFADDGDARFNRSDIVANLDGTNVQTGIPLTLTVMVVDTEKGCAPYVNAQIDIWHCNSSGVYSDQAVENTTTEQWLRGYQMTDAKGQVTFKTVIPGWYQGRTTHIHLRVRSSYSDASSTSDGTNTTQLFFDQSLVDRLATGVAPYSAEGTNATTNVGDHVYTGETMGANLLSLVGSDTAGYVASLVIGLPIAGEATSDGGSGGPSGGPGGGPGGEGGPPGGEGGPPGGEGGA